MVDGAIEGARLILTGNSEVVQITVRSLETAAAATAMATLVGMPIGVLLGLGSFRGKQFLKTLFNALVGIPTVTLGLFLFVLFSRSGPMGYLELLYTVSGIAVGEAVLVTPLIISFVASAVEAKDVGVRDLTRTLGASEYESSLAVVREAWSGVSLALVSSFNRAFAELGIERMTVANGALREGVLYELLGRMHHQDTREATVNQFQRRYHVDRPQAERVQTLALELLGQIAHRLEMEQPMAWQYLSWAARLHEIGISIAHSGYHKHAAYIIENADMPGFSRMEQQVLGLLLRAQRRSMTKLPSPPTHNDHLALIMALRLAVLFHRNRMETLPPLLELEWGGNRRFDLKLDKNWLRDNPLTDTELAAESLYWKDINITLAVND